MAAFFPYLSIAFFTLLLGLNWRNAGNSTYIDEYALTSISRALYASWVIVFLSYWLGLGNLFYFLLILILILHARRSGERQIIFSVSGVFLFLFIGLFWAWDLTKSYSLIFENWDAIVSWNRWAMELFNNRYVPLRSAYPIFFPGLWSLIYKAQGDTTIWIFSKATLWVLPLIVLLALTSLYRINMLVGAIAGYFAANYFVYHLPQPLMSGYMDMPSAALGFASLVLLLIACHAVDADKDGKAIYSRLAIAAPLFGVLAVIKQPGFLLTIFFLAWLFYFFAKRIINRKQLITLLSISIFPVASYFAIFLSLGGQSAGNLHYLTKIAHSHSHGHLISHGFQLLVNNIELYPAIALLLLASLNFLKFRKLKAKMGIWSLLLFIIGSLAYCYFFSYDDRNAMWLFAPLLVSASAALLEFMPNPTLEQPIQFIKQWKINWLIIIVSITGALLLSLLFPYKYIATINARLTENRLIPHASIVLRTIRNVGRQGALLSASQPMAFVSTLNVDYGLTLNSFTSFVGNDSGRAYDICGTKTPTARSLTDIMACKKQVFLYVTKQQSRVLRSKYPDLVFDIVEQKQNWVMLKPHARHHPVEPSSK